MKCYFFHLNFPYLITFKKVALYLKNIFLSGWIWRILPKKKKNKGPRRKHFQKFSNTVQKGGGVHVFRSVYFLICLSALEKKQSWSWQAHPSRSGSPGRAPSPTTTKVSPSWPPNSQPSEPCTGIVSKRPCLQLCLRALRCHFSAAYKEQCWAWPCSAKLSGTLKAFLLNLFLPNFEDLLNLFLP